MSAGAVVGVIQNETSLVLMGDEADVLDLVRHFDVPSDTSLSLPPDLMSLASLALQGLAEVESRSACWLKLTEESLSRVEVLGGFSHAKDTGFVAGVLRGDKGRIAHHLTFDNAALTPATLASLSTMATSVAIQAAIKDISDYLEKMDAKLDRLLMERKVEALAELGGISTAIDEAMTIYNRLGSVSATTWSKVQANATDLHVVQSLAIEKVRALADEVEDAGPTAKLGDVAPRVQADVLFWLAVLAKGIALQDKLYVLEIGRVLAESPGEVEAHRAAIQIARQARLEKVHRTLRSMTDRLRLAGALPNHIKVAHPVKVTRVVTAVNSVNRQVASFAHHAHLEELLLADLSDVRWADAARILLDDTSSVARTVTDAAVTGALAVGRTAAVGIKTFGEKVEEARDQAVLDRAAKVRAKRQLAERESRRREEVASAGSEAAVELGDTAEG